MVQAVNLAKDVNSNEILAKMYREGEEIIEEKIAENFANFFENKISKLLANVVIDPGVYNGTRKLQMSQNANFMTSSNIRKAITTIKMKNADNIVIILIFVLIISHSSLILISCPRW